MIRTKGLTHIHLLVRNMKRSLRFYQMVFGMKVTHKIGRKMAFLNTPGSRDVITLHEDADPGDIVGTTGGIAHFGFELTKTNLDAAITEVKKGGGRLVERGEHAPGIPYVYVADPDGYVIELG